MRWCDEWKPADRRNPSVANARNPVSTSGGSAAHSATSQAIIRRRLIACAHWNAAEADLRATCWTVRACAHDLEGIVGKLASGRYHAEGARAPAGARSRIRHTP